MNFWQQLPKPFFVLAPMDDVTDVAFRQLVAETAPPDVYFTEFVSTDGLQSPGREHTMERLRMSPKGDDLLVAQIWGNNPELYYKTAQDIAKLGGFAGIDINLGCPERGIVARGCCGGLIGQNNRVADLVAAVRAGAPNLPVSIKTRLGLGTIITEDWASFLLSLNLAALTIHARTVREMSRVPAHWDEIPKVVALRNQIAPKTLIIGNGDVENRAHGLVRATESGVDGIMIGRGIFHDIFTFSPNPPATVLPDAMLSILLRHLDLYEEWGSTKPYNTLKKFFKIYVNSWPGANDLRIRLMDSKTPAEARTLIAENVIHTPRSTPQTPFSATNR